uniref:Polygalacturonase n=1 Tax=Arundo donax TaxID=35708 RepID=A0A0A9D5G4_ARUDO
MLFFCQTNHNLSEMFATSCIRSNVVIASVNVLAPHDSPNTNGIDLGDDLISIKSGWDEYGIAFGHPSSGITIRRITGSGPFAGFAVGSETSGGVENVLVEHFNLFSMGVGIHIKTNSGRGGFIRNITVSEVTLNGARYGLRIAGDVGGHPDTSHNPNVLPVVDSVTIRNVWGQNIRQAGLIRGIRNSVFSHICLSNVKLYGDTSIGPWKCRAVSGGALDVHPSPCTELASTSETGFCTN